MSEIRLDDLTNPVQSAGRQTGWDLLTVVATESEQPKESSKVAPLTFLAGTTAGLTDLVVDRFNYSASQTLAEATGRLMTGNVNQAAVDKLTNYALNAPPKEFGLTTGAFKESTRTTVGEILSSADYVTRSTMSRDSIARRFADAQQGLQAEITKVSDELTPLQRGAHARYSAMDMMHSERYGVTAFNGKTGVSADELRKMAADFMPPGESTFRAGLLDRASRMAPGETVTPHQALTELIPAWNDRLHALNAEDALQSHLTEKLEHLQSVAQKPAAASSVAHSYGMRLRQPLFPAGDSARAVMTELQHSAAGLQVAEARLAQDMSKLSELSLGLNQRMHSELLPGPVALHANAFGRSFGKGVFAMSAGIGVGCLVDHLTGEERSTLDSPLGMGLDAGAGLILASGMPAKYKVPLALATMVVPRVLNHYEIGPNQLAPTKLSSSSLWAPNAVDGIGVGLAVGLPVDGRIKAGVAGASIVAGRAYNAYNYKPADKNLLRPY